MKLTEKIAYMKGLLDGMGLSASTNEGKAILQMSDVMEEIAIYVEDLQSQVDELTELCDILDEDLGEVESDLYDDDDDDDDESVDDDEDDRHQNYRIGSVLNAEDFDFDEDDEDTTQYEVKCPSCGDAIYIDEGMLEEGSMACPGCGEILEFDYDAIIPGPSAEPDDDTNPTSEEPTV